MFALLEWSKEDYLKLIGRIPCDEKDDLRSTEAIKILKWDKVSDAFFFLNYRNLRLFLSFSDQVKFKSYSEEDCEKRFRFIAKRLRQHKVLSEILKESLKTLENETFDRSQVRISVFTQLHFLIA